MIFFGRFSIHSSNTFCMDQLQAPRIRSSFSSSIRNPQPFFLFSSSFSSFLHFSVSVKSKTLQIVFKTDSVQSSSNTCKNCLLKIFSQHGNFLNAI